ncbi:unnamed protein product [Caenorhabditis sp. 36 PRJEB53466]|nr:unnamed protein product [Caenorhabditis sp. 36 PRJEB53466]
MTEEVNIFLSKLVLHGESILAEIFRLSSFVPKDFRNPQKSAKFRSIVQLDFKYLSKTEQIEKELEKDLRLQTQFYATFEPVLIAFGQLFTSIAEFVQTFTSYAQEIAEEVKNGQRIDASRTAELETYCLYISGLLLIYLDSYLPGPIRERIYVAIYRKSDVRENAEFLVDFLKATGANDCMIRRLELPESFVRSCLGTIEAFEDSALKIPKTQLMYVILQFDRHTLTTDNTRMTKIVNSVFREIWVLNLGFGVIANIFDAWYPYKAAWNALNATLTPQESAVIMEKHLRIMKSATFPQVRNGFL